MAMHSGEKIRRFSMQSSRLKPLTLLLVPATFLLFLACGHQAAIALITFQQTKQLKELVEIALRRSESAVDFSIAALEELATSGSLGCDSGTLQNLRLHVYRHGVVKDIRLVDSNATVLCSAYSETLEFDQGWIRPAAMLPSRKPSVRLFKVEQFFGSALGIMKETGAEQGLVAIVSMTASSLELMPPELEGAGIVTLSLSNGEPIATTMGAVNLADDDVLTLSAESDRYPLRTALSLNRASLAGWDEEPYAPIMALSGLLGAVFGFMMLRVSNLPPNPLQELDRAIAANEFRPYLQPLFDLRTGAITGAEILARWIRADGKVVPPSRFIELAEESGRIATITWHLLSQALRELRPVLIADRSFKVSVNISPRHFVMQTFSDDLGRTIAEAGASPSQVTLELTEREALPDMCRAAEMVTRVHRLGCKVAIDDVGIGHSGLSQIQSLHADTLKIDKFFVDCIGRDPSAVVVIEMLVRLAAKMNMSVVAEGVESDEQAAILRSCGVTLGQGFFVAPPLSLDEFRQFIDESAMRLALGESGKLKACVA
jgi:sensor c-di-GMP phosphodiesterase-like protein